MNAITGLESGPDPDFAEANEALVDLMAELCQVPLERQHRELLWWARSSYWSVGLMFLTGWQGKVARAAWKAHKRELDAYTPGKRWYESDWRLGRASIARLTGVAEDENWFYAVAPFRTWIEHDGSDEGVHWIAGAIGSPPILSPDDMLDWEHIDITDVILWNPRTNEVRVEGEHPRDPRFVLPGRSYMPERLTIWGDGGAFFRAWAEKRARRAAYRRADKTNFHPWSESAGSDLPGALLIGDIARARFSWPHGLETVVAGPGVTTIELYDAMIRAANLPRIEGGDAARGN